MTNPSQQSSDQSGEYKELWEEHEDNIGVLIRKTDRYIVYIDKEDDLDWGTTVPYDQSFEHSNRFDAKRHAKVDIAIGLAETVPLKELPQKTIHAYLKLLGHAMVCRFELEYDSAEAVLERASKYIGERRSEKSREWYLDTAIRASAFPIIGGLLLVLGRTQATQLLGNEGFHLALACSAGATGALFSIIWRTGRIDFDRFAPARLHRIESRSRIIAGCISGLLAGLAIRSHVISGTWALGDHPTLVMLTVALAAGTGERLASSIIDRVHAGVSKKKPEKRASTNAAN